MLLRGARARCPRCGSGGIFLGWFTMRDSCPRCGLAFVREEGTFLGAFVVNFAATEAVLAVTIVSLVAATVPDIPAFKLSLVAVAVVTAFPIAFYPLSKSIWAAIDLILHPEVGEGDPARSDHHQ
jgi:uncharacterized protein (DUF983 family)